MSVIRRADDDLDQLFAWWPGSQLTVDSRLECGPDEAVLVVDEHTDRLVATLGPGTHSPTGPLQPWVGGGQVLVIFLTTAPTPLEVEGVLDDHEGQPWVELKAVVAVTDPARALELLPRLDDDESPDEGLAEELMVMVARAVKGRGGLAELQRAQDALAAQTEALANAELAALGFEVKVSALTFSASESDLRG